MASTVNPRRFDWNWNGRRVAVGYDESGSGPPVVLLPALSTVSTREEMATLADVLAGDHRVLSVDWPGFGRNPRPHLPYGPDLYRRFLADFLASVVTGPALVVAAGHAAGYALLQGRDHPGCWNGMVLVAPTWRGPLPTVAGGYRPWQRRIRRLVETPVLGHALYRVNTMRPVIRRMYQSHVYADPARVTSELLHGKTGLARQRGARFASVAFVTGGLDPVRDRQSFLALLQPPPARVQVIYGADTPRRSRAEMEAIAELPGVPVIRLPGGSLTIHEELGEQVAGLVRDFITRGAQNAGDAGVADANQS